MSQNLGWIKQHRSMLYKFSENKKLNSELWTLYHYLVQKAAYDDMIDVNRGHVKMSISFIQKDFLPQFSRVKVFRLLQHLVADGSIKLTLTKNKNAGYHIEVCHYDQFYGKNDENQCNTSETQVKHKCNTGNCGNDIQSLVNNCAENEQCNTSETQVKHKCNSTECSYIEERKKKKNEELNTLPDTGEQCRDPFDEIILDDQPKKIKKPKKPKKEKPVGKSVAVLAAYEAAYEHRWHVRPLTNSSKVRSQACKIADQIPAESIEPFMWFYLSHNDPFYIKMLHPLGLCLAQIEKIHTEFQKNDYVTQEFVDSFKRNKARKFRI